MINKRLLIKNLLAHNDESSFYDKKRQLNLHTKEGKAKFLKHICALSNSNPTNNSYIVVGVEDQDNEIVGDDFFDDSRIQNLVNAFLENPPKIQYENVPFPNLPKDRVVGLVTIRPKNKVSFFKKGIYNIMPDTVFVRVGSNSMPLDGPFEKNYQNTETVIGIENNSRNSIAYTLDGVIDFMNVKHKDISPKYKVFKELFVICWAGTKRKVREQTFLSRVDIALINEQIKLFYSAQDDVTIEYNDDTFTIIEYVPLGLNDQTSYYPLEKQTIRFFDNGYYKIDRQMLFEPPEYSRKMLFHIYNSNQALIDKLQKGFDLSERELRDLYNLPSTFMICYLNGFDEAKQKLIDAKLLLKPFPKAYVAFKEAMRILRKMKYDVG
ncbi:ATP-binding protein [Flavobacterium caeni]|uniref:Putative DNA-binding domain-containing protein n=1 Tax=Flavobacterium caeni TaxID=490189 RepID=A0A1G5GX24_9FLAO|nr:ATP-binding protein [Flavobacterium caeni]SCY56175.1 Putative DNA-binding domain-containing protein [Flavobacterium caeni]